MDNIIKITPVQIQTNGARILNIKQEDEAHDLKLRQHKQAQELLESTFGPPTRESVAASDNLKASQSEAANALKKSQQENASLLAAAHKHANQAAEDNAQALSLVLGGYSIQNDDKD